MSSEHNSLTSQKSEASMMSPITSEASRFVEKGSLYLDVGKPEVDGQIVTVSNGSMGSSPGVKMETENLLSPPKSSFARKPLSPSESKGVGETKKSSFSVQNPANQQLKAAILNFVRMNSEHFDESEANERELNEIDKIQVQVPYQEPLMSASKGKSKQESPENIPENADSSNEADDVDDENLQPNNEFEQLQVTIPREDSSKKLKKQLPTKSFFYTFV